MTGRVLVVGDLVTDVVAVLAGTPAAGSDIDAQIRLTGGGQAANTAAWLAWQGVPVTLVAVAGADDAGRARVDELAGIGVTCAVRHCPDAPTGTVVVLTDGGDRTMIADRGANLLLRPADVDRALAAAPDAVHLHLSGYTLLDAASRAAGRHALRAARQRALTVSADAASARPLQRVGAAAFLEWVRDVDLLLANGDEAAALTGDLTAGESGPAARCHALARVTRAGAIVKLGADGALWAAPRTPADPAGTLVAVPAHPHTAATPADPRPPATPAGPLTPDAPANPRSAVARANPDPSAPTAGPGVPSAGPGLHALPPGRGPEASHRGPRAGPASSGPDVVSASPVPVVDPTGAGDAFAAGLIAAWVTGADPAAALRAGARLGAAAVATLGSRPPPLPSTAGDG